MANNLKAVFFDCWDTLIRFETKTSSWNTQCLEKHSKNHQQVDWEKVHAFANDFLMKYLHDESIYEIQAVQFLTMLTNLFKIELDCPVSVCVHEILSLLSPSPLANVEDFLDLLNRDGIFHAVLSNTIYDAKESFDLLNHLLPKNGLSFFLGSSEIGVRKPSSLFFEAGLSKAGFEKHNSIYIGDSLVEDVFGSRKAGFHKSIWLNWKKADYIDSNRRSLSEMKSVVVVSSYHEIINLYKEARLWK